MCRRPLHWRKDRLLDVDEGLPSVSGAGGSKIQRTRLIWHEPNEMALLAADIASSGYSAPCSEPLHFSCSVRRAGAFGFGSGLSPA